ncbi:MAG: CpsD/CapB family tyrosine-protein kinase [Planctomycetes bacterium]|nr:CpsD/CapB family tyrosine-protein kinase [Planctomycetota bacterium]
MTVQNKAPPTVPSRPDLRHLRVLFSYLRPYRLHMAGAALALSLAAKSKRVVMIDGNFRQPALQTLFPRRRPVAKEASSAYGLSNLLMGQCNIRQGLRPSGAKGLDLIDTGLLPPNPTELLASGRMEVLLAELSKVYDHIILDSSPILLVSDPKVLSRIVDATVLVCHAAYTRRGAAQRALSELARVDANVVGCVLLGVRAIRGGYFRKQYKGYHRYMDAMLAG